MAISLPTRLSRFSQIRTALEPKISHLQSVMENSAYHKGSVYCHTIKVAEAVIRLLQQDVVAFPQIQARISQQLDSVVDQNSQNTYTRAELLYAAAFVHDVGKAMGDVMAHAKTGAPNAATMSQEALNLSETEASFIGNLVYKHMEGFNLWSAIQAGPGKKGSQADHEQKLKAAYLEAIGYSAATIIHTMADISGCDIALDEIETSIRPHRELLVELFSIRKENVAVPALLEKVQALSKKYGVILIPGLTKAWIKDQLKQQLDNDFAARVKAGKVPADKAPGIMAKLLDSLTAKIECQENMPNADTIEANFDFIGGQARKPVILQLNLV